MIPSYFSLLQPQLVEDEGRVNHVYKDSLGFDTIGVGHLIDARKGGRLSDAVIQQIFNEDCMAADDAARRHFDGFDMLDDARKAVLANMAFQLGNNLRAFVNFREAVANRDWSKAAAEMRSSLWARQTPHRAERLARIMEGK